MLPPATSAQPKTGHFSDLGDSAVGGHHRSPNQSSPSLGLTFLITNLCTQRVIHCSLLDAPLGDSCCKAKRRRAPGTGRMTYLKTMARRFKNGFREGTTAPARKKKADGRRDQGEPLV